MSKEKVDPKITSIAIILLIVGIAIGGIIVYGASVGPLQSQVANLQSQVTSLQSQVSILEGENADLQDEVTNLTNQLAKFWLSGWGYRKSHTIILATGARTNYQIKITVHYGTGTDSGADVYCNSKCKINFGDIRFTSGDGTTEIDYWIESKIDSDNAIFWVEVSEDLSSKNRTIYLYYGKSDAATTSNGNNTFLYFDDFENPVGQIPNNWIESENPTYGTCSSVITGFRGNGIECIATKYPYRAIRSISLSGSFAVEGQYMASDNGEFVLMDQITNYHLAHRRQADKDNFMYLKFGTIWTDTGITKDSNWHKFKYLVKESSDQFRFYFDTFDSGWQTIYGNGTSVSQWGHRFQQTGTNDSDELFARKYADPEPSNGAWGGEETGALFSF